MEKLKDYNIVFSGLKQGRHIFEFEVDPLFFDFFGVEQEFNDSKITVKVYLEKFSSFMEMKTKIKGKLNFNCDVSDIPYWEPVKNKMKMVIKFGEKYDDSEDEIITLPYHEHQINIRQLIYETVILSIPMKKVHPNILSGKDKTYDRLLDKYLNHELKEQDTDPRWAELNKLKK